MSFLDHSRSSPPALHLDVTPKPQRSPSTHHYPALPSPLHRCHGHGCPQPSRPLTLIAVAIPSVSDCRWHSPNDKKRDVNGFCPLLLLPPCHAFDVTLSRPSIVVDDSVTGYLCVGENLEKAIASFIVHASSYVSSLVAHIQEPPLSSGHPGPQLSPSTRRYICNTLLHRSAVLLSFCQLQFRRHLPFTTPE